MVFTYHCYEVLERKELIKGEPLTREKVIERVIEEVNRLRPVKEGVEGALEKARGEILQRRLERFEKNRDRISNNVSLVEKAYRLIYEYDRGIDLRFVEIVEKTEGSLVLHARNYCPTLIACEILNLSTQFICKEMHEPTMQEVCKLIDRNLTFTRDYGKIRPGYTYCEEKFLLKG